MDANSPVPVTARLDAPQPFVLECWRAFGRHRLVSILIVAGVMCLIAAALAVVPARYRAVSEVMLEARHIVVLKNESVLSSLPSDSDTVSSEGQVLESRDMLRGLVKDLHLDERPEFDPTRPGRLAWVLDRIRPWIPEGWSSLRQLRPEEIVEAVVDSVKNHLDVSTVGRSRVLKVSFTSESPEAAAEVVNSLSDRYVVRQTESKREATQQANRWIGDSLPALRKAQDDSTRLAEEFRAQSGLVNGKDSTLLRQQLSELNTQLVAATADRVAIDARLNEMEREVREGVPDGGSLVQASRIIQGLKAQQGLLAARNSELKAIQGPRNPYYIASQAQMEDNKRRIDGETNKVLMGLSSDRQSSLNRENSLRQTMETVKQEIVRGSGDEVKLQQLTQEADANRSIYLSFLQRSKETQGAFQVPDAVVISHAAVPLQPFFPDPRLVVPLGFVLALGGACLAVFLSEIADRSFHTRDEVEKSLGIEVLGTIPEVRRKNWSESTPDPLSLLGSAMMELYMMSCGPDVRTLLIASSLPLEGKTTTGLCLARVAALNGRRVLVVDADLRRTGLRGKRAVNYRGLSDHLDGLASFDEIQQEDVPGVMMVAAGTNIRNPVGLLSSHQMREFIERARSSFDLVILDSPPVFVGPDAWAMTQLVDRTLMFIRWGQTPRRVVRAALKRLDGAVGAVLSMVDMRRMDRHSSYGVGFSKQIRRYYPTPDA